MCFVQLVRFLNTTNVIESKANEIASRLGIPERPKKPLTGYFRFIQDIRPSLVKNDASPREVMALIGAEWKKLDENKKQKYNEQFERDRVIISNNFAFIYSIPYCKNLLRC